MDTQNRISLSEKYEKIIHLDKVIFKGQDAF